MASTATATASSSSASNISPAAKYRGVSNKSWSKSQNLANPPAKATVEDLEPPSALSIAPTDTISYAMMCAFERDYTHLTVVDKNNRALLGYVSMPRLKQLLEQHQVKDTDTVEKAMQKFQRRKGNPYKIITLDTPLEELEAFFQGGADGSSKQDFAVVTDDTRKFVLGVATKEDLEDFVRRRPA